MWVLLRAITRLLAFCRTLTCTRTPLKAFIICSGLDMVNIRATNVICKDTATAEVCVRNECEH